MSAMGDDRGLGGKPEHRSRLRSGEERNLLTVKRD
jgi:hypothetical protein